MQIEGLTFDLHESIMSSMIPRTLDGTLRRALRTFPVAVVTGPRQSGKTTLLRHGWAATHRYLSMENPDTRARALADPVGFLRDNPPPAILDEIQYAPELLPYIKAAVDADRAPGRWILTGSQSFALMQNVTESLAGRAAVLSLLPLAAEEITGSDRACPRPDDLLMRLQAADDGTKPPTTPADWLLRGTYPEMRSNPEVDRELWYASYYQTYLERDVRQVLNVGSLSAFDRFVRLAAARNAQMLNVTDLGRDAGVAAPTARSWLSVLEAAGVIYLLPPFHANFGKRLVKSPKLFFLDPGLVTFLLGLHSPEPLLRGPFIGPLMESAVVSEWVKLFRHRGLPPPLSFWRSHDGLEVDLLVEWNGVVHPMEIKATSTVTPSHAAALQKWRALAGQPDVPGTLVATCDAPCAVAPGVRAVPWWWV